MAFWESWSRSKHTCWYPGELHCKTISANAIVIIWKLNLLWVLSLMFVWLGVTYCIIWYLYMYIYEEFRMVSVFSSMQFVKTWSINTLRQRPHGHHFADRWHSKCIIFDEIVWMQIKMLLKFVPRGPFFFPILHVHISCKSNVYIICSFTPVPYIYLAWRNVPQSISLK